MHASIIIFFYFPEQHNLLFLVPESTRHFLYIESIIIIIGNEVELVMCMSKRQNEVESVSIISRALLQKFIYFFIFYAGCGEC